MRLDGKAWRTFFDGFQREAFRLESLQVYDMASEQAEYDHFLATGELHIPDDDQWLTRVRHFRGTGRWVGRVHVVTRPLTDYLRYEFAIYRHTVPRRRGRSHSGCHRSAGAAAASPGLLAIRRVSGGPDGLPARRCTDWPGAA